MTPFIHYDIDNWIQSFDFIRDRLQASQELKTNDIWEIARTIKEFEWSMQSFGMENALDPSYFPKDYSKIAKFNALNASIEKIGSVNKVKSLVKRYWTEYIVEFLAKRHMNDLERYIEAHVQKKAHGALIQDIPLELLCKDRFYHKRWTVGIEGQLINETSVGKIIEQRADDRLRFEMKIREDYDRVISEFKDIQEKLSYMGDNAPEFFEHLASRSNQLDLNFQILKGQNESIRVIRINKSPGSLGLNESVQVIKKEDTDFFENSIEFLKQSIQIKRAESIAHREIEKEKVLLEKNAVSYACDEIYQKLQTQINAHEIQYAEEVLASLGDRILRLKGHFYFHFLSLDEECQRLESNIAYLYQELKKKRTDLFSSQIPTLNMEIEQMPEALKPIPPSFQENLLYEKLNANQKIRVENNDNCAPFEKIAKEGWKKKGFLFFENFYKGGRFKEVREAFAVYFYPKTGLIKSKEYVASAKGKKMRVDFVEEREGLFHLHGKFGTNAMANRLCDYSQGRRTPQSFIPSSGVEYHIYKKYEKGSLEDRKELFNQDKTLLLNISIDILRNIRTAHREGVFHGDLSPKNLLIDSQNKTVLMDIAEMLSIKDDLNLIPYTPFYAPIHFHQKFRLREGKASVFDRQLLDIYGSMRCFEYLISPRSPQAFVIDLQSSKEENGDLFYHPFEDKASGKDLYWKEVVYETSPIFSKEELLFISQKIRLIKNNIENLMKSGSEAREENVAQISQEFESFLIGLQN